MKCFLLHTLRDHLEIADKYPDAFVELNLFYFFVQNEKATLRWVDHIESYFDVKIPDQGIDFFFFSSLDNIIEKLHTHGAKFDR